MLNVLDQVVDSARGKSDIGMLENMTDKAIHWFVSPNEKQFSTSSGVGAMFEKAAQSISHAAIESAGDAFSLYK